MKFFRFLKMWWTLPGRVMYDPQTNKVLRVKSIERSRAICGGQCDFYSSARSTTSIEPLSLDYIEKCEVIKTVDKTPNLFVDHHGWWRVKEI